MSYLKIKAQLMRGDVIAFGPGKADLLDAIARTGSISAAGREMEMSYRRAWQLVDAMNRCFEAPLVETERGGSSHGGATVTPLGRTVLAEFRALQDTLEKAATAHVKTLRGKLSS